MLDIGFIVLYMKYACGLIRSSIHRGIEEREALTRTRTSKNRQEIKLAINTTDLVKNRVNHIIIYVNHKIICVNHIKMMLLFGSHGTTKPQILIVGLQATAIRVL